MMNGCRVNGELCIPGISRKYNEVHYVMLKQMVIILMVADTSKLVATQLIKCEL